MNRTAWLMWVASCASLSLTANADTSRQPAQPVPQVAVAYGDLDLDTVAGQRALRYRIERAARRVCPDADTRDLRIRGAGQACMRTAVEVALQAVGEQRYARTRGSKPGQQG